MLPRKPSYGAGFSLPNDAWCFMRGFEAVAFCWQSNRNLGKARQNVLAFVNRDPKAATKCLGRRTSRRLATRFDGAPYPRVSAP